MMQLKNGMRSYPDSTEPQRVTGVGTTPKIRKKSKRNRSLHRFAWILMTPGLTVFILFVFFPMLMTIGLSFTQYDALTTPRFVGFEQYKELFKNQVFWTSLIKSLLLTVGVVVCLAALPIPVAYFLQRNIRGLGWVRALYYIPVVTPIIVSAVAWKWLLEKEGLFNYLLLKFHIISKPIEWLSDPDMVIWSILLVVFWRAFGFYLIIYFSGLVGIPKDIYEAAAIDGANEIQTFFRITLPLLKNTISLVVIISFIAAMKIFDEIFIMTKGGPINASKTTAYLIYEEAFVNMNFGYSSAIAVVLLVVVLGFTIMILKFFERDEVKS